MWTDRYQNLFQQNCSIKNANKKKDTNVFDLQNIKRVGPFFFYFDSFYFLIFNRLQWHLFFIHHYIYMAIF